MVPGATNTLSEVWITGGPEAGDAEPGQHAHDPERAR